jgi:transforming growth factor-beta-induced protein
MRSSVRRTVAIAALSSLALAACGDDEDATADTAAATTDDAITAPPATTSMATMAPETTAPMATMAPATTVMAEQPGTIVDVAAGAGTFNTLVAAVQAAGLVETLSGEGPFTVFAPTDEAFVAALESLGLTADELLADTETLTSILTYHVVAGVVPSSQVVTMDGQSVATVNGADITISVDGDTVMVNDATVTAVDIPASNGVIHVIDSVLLPPAT